MGKMSEGRKIKKGLIKGPIKYRNLDKKELHEYLELIKVCSAQHWKAAMIANNTALIPNGIEVSKIETAIAVLLENSKNNWLSRVLANCGVPLGQSVNINSTTGKIEFAKVEEKKDKVDAKKDETLEDRVTKK